MFRYNQDVSETSVFWFFLLLLNPLKDHNAFN